MEHFDALMVSLLPFESGSLFQIDVSCYINNFVLIEI
jgi:hypothetical protein